jgi:hypothetical protein
MAVGAKDIEVDRMRARNSARLDDAGQLRGMIDVQMSEQYDVELLQIDMRFAETSEGAWTRVDQNPRLPVNEEDVARGCSTFGTGPTRAEHQQFYVARGRRGMLGRRLRPTLRKNRRTGD